MSYPNPSRALWITALLLASGIACAQDSTAPAQSSSDSAAEPASRRARSVIASNDASATSAGRQDAEEVDEGLRMAVAKPERRGPRSSAVTVTAAVPKPAAAGDFTTEAAKENAIHLTVGRSLFLSTKHRLARVYVTNPTVVESYTASANQIVLTAKQPGVSSVILWDETGEQEDFLVSSEADIEMLRESLKDAMPNEPVTVQQSNGRILISGTVGSSGSSEAAARLASAYSKDVANAVVIDSAKVKQIQLKVRVIEIDRNKIGQFAVNFFNGGGNKIIQSTTGQFASTATITEGGSACASNATGCKTVGVSNALNYFLYSSKLNVGATIEDLETMQLAQILAEPTITTMSGQKANFLAGGEFPFPIVSNAGGVANVSIQFRPYGVKVEFTPIVNPDGTIDLKVAPEVSALDYTNAVTISGYTIPAISTRRAETRVVLTSGQTFAIAGLIDQRTTDQFAKTPGIASVPVLGELFKSKNTAHSRTELLVMVTPTVVDLVGGAPAVDAPQLPAKLLDKQDFDQLIPKPRRP